MATTRGNDTAVGWWMRAGTAAPGTATATATGTGRVADTATATAARTSVTAASTNVIATAPCRVRVHSRARGPVARGGHPQHPADAVQRLERHVRRGHAQPVLEPHGESSLMKVVSGWGSLPAASTKQVAGVGAKHSSCFTCAAWDAARLTSSISQNDTPLLYCLHKFDATSSTVALFSNLV